MALKTNHFSFSKEFIQFAIEWWYLRSPSLQKTRNTANFSQLKSCSDIGLNNALREVRCFKVINRHVHFNTDFVFVNADTTCLFDATNSKTMYRSASIFSCKPKKTLKNIRFLKLRHIK